MEGLLFIVSGPSGTGKGTICKEVVKRTGIGLSVSATTRPPRKGEENGKDYFFLTEAEFVKMIEEDGFLEHVENFGKRYGTPEFHVRKRLEEGEDIILEIDVQGAEKVKKKFPDSVLIFVLPPTIQELHRRIQERGTESEESIQMRLGRSRAEIGCVWEYDYYIVNDELEKAVCEMVDILSAEHNRVRPGLRELLQKFEEARDALS